MSNLPTKQQSLSSDISGTDVLAPLLEFSWKGVAFPASSFRVHFRQDNVEHKYSEKDGSEREPTGRLSTVFEARIGFLNNTSPGQSESWPAGALFPDQYLRFISKVADRAKGPLQHPIFGKVTCVLDSCVTDVAGTTRDGAWVDATWSETFDDTNGLSAILRQLSPMSEAISAAQDLDLALGQLQPPPPATPTFTPNFGDTMRSIQAVFDTATLFSKSVAGTINEVNYRCNAIAASINQQPSTPTQSIQSVMNGPTRRAIDRLRLATIKLRTQVAQSGRRIGLYLPKAPATLSMIAIDTNSNLTDLFALNGPSVVFAAAIPANTTVRYYLAA